MDAQCRRHTCLQTGHCNLNAVFLAAVLIAVQINAHYAETYQMEITYGTTSAAATPLRPTSGEALRAAKYWIKAVGCASMTVSPARR